VPAFNYTGGDISHLTPGGAASMTDLQGPLTDVRTAINGNLDEINVPNLSAAFTTWKTIQWGSGTPTSGIVTVGGTYGLYPAAGSASAAWTTGLAPYSFYLNPADYLANARTTKLRLRAQCVVNGAAPGTNIVPGLYPVSSFGGASGASPTIAGVGTVITGSTVIFTTPAASSNTVSTSTEFNAPAAAAYVFMAAIGGGFAAGSQVSLMLQLQMRQV
jgi:hypothetical protein